ncbi:hypothetical protein [Sphingomonas sp. IW22]|uniref:hypothetical protein n=1 Tax=Sphingomonas sp. IW22 TaxID=3242489 RepID=UPI00351FBF78
MKRIASIALPTIMPVIDMPKRTRPATGAPLMIRRMPAHQNAPPLHHGDMPEWRPAYEPPNSIGADSTGSAPDSRQSRAVA